MIKQVFKHTVKPRRPVVCPSRSSSTKLLVIIIELLRIRQVMWRYYKGRCGVRCVVQQGRRPCPLTGWLRRIGRDNAMRYEALVGEQSRSPCCMPDSKPGFDLTKMTLCTSYSTRCTSSLPSQGLLLRHFLTLLFEVLGVAILLI